ncbi:heme/hemin ABC transporter substrate-binding protein [Elioraea rosea]|uniref:heme/hemin ABC transporter substrate-binding protein n=1 Tax=Elioraea rosea TaxID=2492390 RepID=UPI0011831DBF|nr:ABC transporter substrate-binding protein [Elioraea rosea]
MLSRRTALAAPVLLAGTARAHGRRIVVAGGGIAEIVVALGAGGDIVAADSTALFPRRLTRLPQVGYLRSLGAEGVLSASPTLLILANEAGPPEAVAQLERSGVRVVRAPRVTGRDSLIAAVRVLAATLGAEARGDAMAQAIAADFDALTGIVAGLQRRPSAVFVLAAGGGAPQASGTASAADAMLGLAGARNAITAYRGYKPVSAEALLAADPEALVTTTHTMEALGGEGGFARIPALAPLAAVRGGRVIVFDSLYLLGFGPRTAHAARDLAAALHGDSVGSLPARPWLAEHT